MIINYSRFINPECLFEPKKWIKRTYFQNGYLHCTILRPESIVQCRSGVIAKTSEKNIRILKSEHPTLKTKRLILREITDLDLENIYNGLSNPTVIKYYGVSFDSLEATKEQMAWFAEKEQIWWAICSPDNQTFYGAGGLNDISQEHKKAEIGLWLLPEFLGKGIMGEAIPLICEYGFNTLDLHRIEGLVETENLNCKKAMAKLDFHHEGTMQDCEIKNGEFISIDVYAKLGV